MNNETEVKQAEADAAAGERYREAARVFVASSRVVAASLAWRAGPGLPSFWTEKQETAWNLIKEAFRRDWLQTMWRLGTDGGADLRQTVTDTREQASGVKPPPGGAEAGLHWDLARHAIRLGHGTATFWVNDTSWGEDVEGRVRAEWSALTTGIAFEQALPLVRYGWDQGRSDMTTTDLVPSCPTAA